MSSETTIPVTKDIRNKLRAIGKKGETYNDILTRLLAQYQTVAIPQS